MANNIKFSLKQTSKLSLSILIAFSLSGCAYSQEKSLDQPQISSQIPNQKSPNPSVQILETFNEHNEVEPKKTLEIDLTPNQQNRITSKLKANPWSFLHAYKARYDVYSEGDKLGQADRTMSSLDGFWTLSISSTLKKWLLTLKSHEFTNFMIDENQLHTNKFYTSTKISFKKERVIEQHFNWHKMLETGSKDDEEWELPLELNEAVYDRMSHTVQLRADLLQGKDQFEYQVSYKGKRKLYLYEVVSKENISTAMGNFDTIRVNRITGDDANFSMWLSPELNYFPVKISQIEQDKPDVELILSTLEFVNEITN